MLHYNHETHAVCSCQTKTLHLLLDKRDEALCEGDDPAIHVVVRQLQAALTEHKRCLLLLQSTNRHQSH